MKIKTKLSDFMQGNCLYNGIQLVHHTRFKGLKVQYVLNIIGDSGSLNSFDKVLGFFLTQKKEDFYLSLQDNDLSMTLYLLMLISISTANSRRHHYETEPLGAQNCLWFLERDKYKLHLGQAKFIMILFCLSHILNIFQHLIG